MLKLRHDRRGGRPIFAPVSVATYRKQYAAHGKSLFLHPAWLDAVGGDSWRVAATRAHGLPYRRHRRWGSTVLRHPPLTPFLEPLAYPTAAPSERVDWAALLDALPPHARAHFLLGYDLDHWVPFYRRGWLVRPRYSYQLDLARSPAERLAAYKYSLRRTVKRAPTGLALCPLPLPGAYARFEAHLRARGSGTGVRQAQFEQLHRTFAPTDELQLWGLYRDARLLASLCLAIDEGTAYCLLTERDERRDDVHAMHVLYHRVIEHCAAAGVHTFDFNGSMLPGVAAFNRAFGGRRRTKYELIHYGSRFWKAASALRGR